MDGRRHDLTANQSGAPIAYADVASSREEALAGTRAQRYEALREAARTALVREGVSGDGMGGPGRQVSGVLGQTG